MNNGINKLTETQHAIINEISTCLENLGASVGYFVAIHSWGDTQSDENVLQMLKDQNIASSLKSGKIKPIQK